MKGYRPYSDAVEEKIAKVRFATDYRWDHVMLEMQIREILRMACKDLADGLKRSVEINSEQYAKIQKLEGKR